jgi:CheY-like chemotaxis protein
VKGFFRGLRVLVVEDEMLVAWVLQDMLWELGCTVIGPAARIPQALAMIRTEGIDAALLDVNLDGQLSYPIAEALSARGVPFAFSTGYDKSRIQQGYQGFPILQKPFHCSALHDLLVGLFQPPTPIAPDFIHPKAA